MNARRLLWLVAVCFVAFVTNVSAPAQAKKISEQKAKTIKVTAFKNGTALYEKELLVKGSGWVQIKPPAGAVLGSFWFATPKGTTIQRLVAKQEKVWAKRTCRSLFELIRGNIGKKAVLLTKDKKLLRGVLGKSLGQFLSLKTKEGFTIVRRKDVLRVSFAANPSPQCRYQKLAPRLRLLIKSSSTRALLGFSYIQKGLEWTPLYRVALGKKSAYVRMQAAVVNHLEGFQKTKLELVAGVPNLLNRVTVSPLSAQAFGARKLGLRRPTPRFHNYYRAQTFSNVRSPRTIRHTTTPSSSGVKLMFGQGQDLGHLFAFKVGLASIAKGARAIVPVIEARLPVKRFYLWQPDQAKVRKAYHRRYRRSNHRIEQIKRNRVWEYLELHNSTKVPLTTGPATLVQKGRFLGQDMLRYTPPGGKVEIPISVAANVLSRQTSIELSRARNARKIRYRWYSRVRRQVTMSLVNFSKSTIRIRVRKRIFGKVSKATGARVQATGDGSSVNLHTELRYTVVLKPKKRWTKTFQYTSYVY